MGQRLKNFPFVSVLLFLFSLFLLWRVNVLKECEIFERDLLHKVPAPVVLPSSGAETYIAYVHPPTACIVSPKEWEVLTSHPATILVLPHGDAEESRKWIKSMRYGGKVILDTDMVFLKFFEIFGVKAPPLKLVVKNGRIVFYEAGPSDGRSVLRAYNFYSGR
ncbi:MAG: hypothetical protein GXO29_05720 [Thermotogae bacterium]|nr:hypothetical protein [Thermotogota bacterium]